MEYELRIATIAPGKLSAFLDAWSSQVVPLRKRLGFTLVSAWTAHETNRVIWILGFDGDEGLAAADAAYYASEERLLFDPEPGEYIVNIERLPVAQAIAV